jgi:hypothetical protein
MRIRKVPYTPNEKKRHEQPEAKSARGIDTPINKDSANTENNCVIKLRGAMV